MGLYQGMLETFPRKLGFKFHDAICAIIVVIAIPVANAKARAIPTKIFFMIVLRRSYLHPADEP
jgi:hypothetical protein